MNTSTSYKVSYEPTLTPVTPHITYDFITELETLITDIYTDRAEKVQTNTPLLASTKKPYYNKSNLKQITAYSLDIRNIKKWSKHFKQQQTPPNEVPTKVKIDIPDKNYSQNDELLVINTGFGDIEFKIENTAGMNINVNNMSAITIEYALPTQTFTLLLEEDAPDQSNDTTLIDTQHTTYDAYQTMLDGTDVEKHQPFAIFSPAVTYEEATQYTNSQPIEAIILITDDEWKVCVRSTDNQDYPIKQNLVETLQPVSDTVEDYYESFPYPNRYIHIPEIQYLNTIETLLTEEEINKLQVLPYAIPFGNESLLFEKLNHAESFIKNPEYEDYKDDFDYKQFLQQTTEL